MTVATIRPPEMPTKNRSGRTFSLRAMSLRGSFHGVTKPHSLQRATTSGSSATENSRTCMLALLPNRSPPKQPFHDNEHKEQESKTKTEYRREFKQEPSGKEQIVGSRRRRFKHG